MNEKEMAEYLMILLAKGNHLSHNGNRGFYYVRLMKKTMYFSELFITLNGFAL